METVKKINNRMKEYCRQKELLAPGDRVILGLSGGADSVCLFLMLKELSAEWNLTLVPVHINHNLRGEDALSDQHFCETLCREHKVPLTVVSVPVAELAAEHGWTLEEAGRNARYEAFARILKEQGCSKIAVAHHKNDQAETVLFQLLRGSRLKGLSGMEARNGNIIRPLLCLERNEIEAYLQEKKQNFCIDRTNFEEEYTRNRIRHKLIPLTKELCPRAVEHITETAEYLSRVESFLEALTKTLYGACVELREECLVLKTEPLQEAERLLAERVVYRVLCEAGGGKKDITAGYVSDCMELLTKQTGRYLNLPGGLLVKKSYGELLFLRKEPSVTSFYEEISTFPHDIVLSEKGKMLTLTLMEFESSGEKNEEKMRQIPKTTYTKWFDYDKIRGVVSWKTPEPEDVIVLYADGRSKSVLDVLKEAKVPKEERKSTGVLAAGNRVLWIPGIRGSEAYHVTKETKRVLIATIDGGNEDGR